MNITDTKFHQLLMYAGRIPVESARVDDAVRIIRRAIAVIHVAGMGKSPNTGRTMDDYVNSVLNGVDLLYGNPEADLRYLIVMEFIDRVRKMQKEEQDFYHRKTITRM